MAKFRQIRSHCTLYKNAQLFYSTKTTKVLCFVAHPRVGQRVIARGSPCLVVMGGDSCSKGREFESRHRILDGKFSHLFIVKIVMCVGKKDENKLKKWPGLAHFYKKRVIAEKNHFCHPQSCESFSFNCKS